MRRRPAATSVARIPALRISLPMEASNDGGIFRFRQVEDRIGEVGNQRTPDLSPDDRVQPWRALYGRQSFSDRHKEFIAQPQPLRLVPLIGLLDLCFRL